MSDHTHTHINLATVTYLFDGALMHRDSLGTVQEIQLSSVNYKVLKMNVKIGVSAIVNQSANTIGNRAIASR
ncbi:MAG: pirin family protein [Nostoc sp.]